MRRIETEVLVIGGGATGTGVLRDLAMRGFKTALVEKRDLSHGTTGRYHGLLHSGGRYVVKDPTAAAECFRENRILRQIMPHCIEDTGGFFVVTPEDDPGYTSRFLEGCKQAGIPVEEISIHEMLRAEPLLNPNIQRCFRVPDAAADSFLASEENVASARIYEAQVFNYHEVLNLIRTNGRIVGARCHDLVKNEIVEFAADIVVNASGAWAGKIAATAGIPIRVFPGKGTMIAINHRVINTVVNRCKMPSDGDIIVPIHTVAVIGTTDVQVPDPDHFSIEPWEVRLMLIEGEKLVPGLSQLRMLRAWAGVRPLYEEEYPKDSRDYSRAYVLLDHELRDGLTGLVTITSGKWTTYRLMAETTVNLVCEKLGTHRLCRTHLEPLPGAEAGHYHRLGARLAKIEEEANFKAIICECELATYDDILQAIVGGEAKTMDDVRREARFGMGPCQGGFCTYRVAGILNEIRHPSVDENNVALKDFLQERWKGLLPILWGSQLRQERLDELIYINVLNADQLPGPQASRLAAEMYTWPEKTDIGSEDQWKREAPPIFKEPADENYDQPLSDTLVIGGGLSGLVTAWQSALAGLQTTLITKGWGATHWHAGTIDVLGYTLSEKMVPVQSPYQAIQELIRRNPEHPYALVGVNGIKASLEAFIELCNASSYPLHGTLERNWMLPTALGAIRPTCLAPETMIAGDTQNTEPMLIVGFEGFNDFYPGLVADNLTAQGLLVNAVKLDLTSLRKRRFITSMTLAQLLDKGELRDEIVTALKPKLGNAGRVGLPAILGLNHTIEITQYLESHLGIPVFEIPTLPPSIPGIRLHNILVNEIKRLKGHVYEGLLANSAVVTNHGVTKVISEAAARQKIHRAKTFVLATGGILGGGMIGDQGGKIHEVVFRLPITSPRNRSEWFHQQFFYPTGHPVFRSGVKIDQSFRPIDDSERTIYDNLYAVGSTLAGEDYLRERSLDGIALATGYQVAKTIVNHPLIR